MPMMKVGRNPSSHTFLASLNESTYISLALTKVLGIVDACIKIKTLFGSQTSERGAVESM